MYADYLAFMFVMHEVVSDQNSPELSKVEELINLVCFLHIKYTMLIQIMYTMLHALDITTL